MEDEDLEEEMSYDDMEAALRGEGLFSNASPPLPQVGVGATGARGEEEQLLTALEMLEL